MADQVELQVVLSGINEGLKSLEKLQKESISAFQKVTKEAEKASKKQAENSEKFNKRIADSYSTLKTAAAGFIAVVAGRAVINAFDDAVKAAAREQDAIQKLNTALQINGNFTEQASKSFQAFADSIEKSTSFSNEAVLSSGALLENLTGLDKDGLQKATLSAVNLSAALGKDLTFTTNLVAKAINGNAGALKRLGVESDGTESKADRLSKVLEKLGRFNNVAAQQSNTFSGATTQLGNAFEDVSKTFGRLIISNAEIVAGFKVITEIVGEIGKVFEESGQPISDMISDMVRLGVSAIPSVITPLQFLITLLNELVQIYNQTQIGLLQLARGLSYVLVGAFDVARNAVLTFQLAFIGLSKIVFGFFENLGVFAKGSVTDGLNKAFDEVTASMRSFADTGKFVESTIGKPIEELQFGLFTANQRAEALTEGLVGGFEKSRPKIERVVDGFDDLVASIKRGPKPLSAVNGLLNDTEEETKDLGKENKNLNSSYDKLNSTFATLTTEVDKQTKSKKELAEIEFANSTALAKQARAELDSQGKLTLEVNNQIKAFEKLAATKRDSSIKGAKDEEDDKRNKEQQKQIQETVDAIKAGFSAGVDIIQDGITQAFRLGSAILNGQIFTELENALKSTILAPIDALASLNSLSSTLKNAAFGQKQTVKDTAAEDLAKKQIDNQIKQVQLQRQQLDLNTSLSTEQRATQKDLLDVEIARLNAKKEEVNITKKETVTQSLNEVFKELIRQLPIFVSEFVKSFPLLVQSFLENFPKFVQELSRAIPVIIDQLVAAFPAVVSTLADAFDEIITKLVDSAPAVTEAVVSALPRIFASLLDGLTKIIDGAPAVFAKIFEGIPNIISSILSRLPQLIRSISSAIPQIVRSLASNISPIISAILNELPGIVQALVENFITLTPEIVFALVDAFIIKGGIFKIMGAIAASVPNIVVAVFKGVANGIGSLGGSVGALFSNAFKTAVNQIKLPKIEAPKFPKIEIPENIKNILTGKRFVDNIKKPFQDLIDGIKGALKPGGSSGGFIGQSVSRVKSAIGRSKGGLATPIYAQGGALVDFKRIGTDTVPAMLTPGELVIPRNDVSRLSAFLDSMEGRNSPNQDMSKILAALDRSSQKEVTVNIQVGEKQLSQVILNLNRQGFRTA